MVRQIEMIGGPAAGKIIEEHSDVNRISVPTSPTSEAPGFGSFEYAVRRFRDPYCNLIELAVPTGEEVPEEIIAERRLKREQ